MARIIDLLRVRPESYETLKKIYGNTLGMWYFKDFFAKHIGFHNGKKRLKMIDPSDADLLISERIKSGKPFMFARYGSTEFRNMFSDDEISLLCRYSGFFPNDKKFLDKFRKIYFGGSRSIDFLLAWNYKNHFFKEIKLIKKLPNVEYVIEDINMHNYEGSWINELKGKKILVVHPFKKTIECQMKKRVELGILPKPKSFEVIRAVQTLAGAKDSRFKTWFDALEYMKKEIGKKDFDIAIIGCGAYGLPLAAYVKSLGKQAMHTAGGTQLLFGIRGRRWNNNPLIKYTDYWISPLEEDKIETYKKVEGGCYW